MKHINETIIIELCAGRLTAEQADEIQVHLDQCADCREKYNQQTQVWMQLGQIPLPDRQVDLSQRVVAQVACGHAAADDSIRNYRLLGRALRFAAVIALSAATGHLLGLGARAIWHQPQVNMNQARLVDESEVAMSLHLDVLGAGLEVGIIEGLTDDQSVYGDHEQ